MYKICECTSAPYWQTAVNDKKSFVWTIIWHLSLEWLYTVISHEVTSDKVRLTTYRYSNNCLYFVAYCHSYEISTELVIIHAQKWYSIWLTTTLRVYKWSFNFTNDVIAYRVHHLLMGLYCPSFLFFCLVLSLCMY